MSSGCRCLVWCPRAQAGRRMTAVPSDVSGWAWRRAEGRSGPALWGGPRSPLWRALRRPVSICGVLGSSAVGACACTAPPPPLALRCHLIGHHCSPSHLHPLRPSASAHGRVRTEEPSPRRAVRLPPAALSRPVLPSRTVLGVICQVLTPQVTGGGIKHTSQLPVRAARSFSPHWVDSGRPHP